MIKRFLSLLLMGVLCLSGAMASAQDEAQEVFTVASTTEPAGMFFTGMWGNNIADMDIQQLIHGASPAYWKDQATLEVNPMVVAGLSIGEYEDGNRAYLVQLQEGLRFSDGSSITAADYLFSIMLQGSPYIPQLGGVEKRAAHIVGFEAYNQGETEVFAGLQLVDALTFMVEVKADYLPYFYELSFLEITPYPISVIAPGYTVRDDGEGAYLYAEDADARPFDLALLQETIMDPQTGYLYHPMVSSGPYKLLSHDTATQTVRVGINEYFMGLKEGEQPSIETIELRHYTPEGAIAAYEAGEVQMIVRLVDGESINKGLDIAAQGEAVTLAYPRMGLGFVNFACEKGVLGSQAVRQAVAYALDKDAFIEQFSRNAMPVYGYYGMGQWMVTSLGQSEAPAFITEEAEQETWQTLSLDGLNHYDLDLDKAIRLLEEDGWTLNADGGAYESGIRHKDKDGAIVPLEIRWGMTEGSVAAQLLEAIWAPALQEIGVGLSVQVVPFAEVLEDYYSYGDARRFDMQYLASNTSNLFDPYFAVSTNDAYMGLQNTTGIRDERLEAMALDLRQTAPGALLTYEQKWIDFQTYWNEVLPMLPLYSNVYFDFYTPELQGYQAAAELNWPNSIVRATLGGEEEVPDMLLDDGEGMELIEQP